MAVEFIEYAGFGLASLGALAGTATWLLGRIEKAQEAAMQSADTKINKLTSDLGHHTQADEREHANLHDRVNRTRDEYLRRDDFDRHVDGLTQQMRQTRDEIREDMKGLTARMDAVLVLMKKGTD